MRNMLWLLVILGFVLQALALYLMEYELRAMLRGDMVGVFTLPDLLLLLSPAILGFGGAAAAAWLQRRGSGWAPVVAAVPLVLLGLALLLVVLLWFNPIRHQP